MNNLCYIKLKDTKNDYEKSYSFDGTANDAINKLNDAYNEFENIECNIRDFILNKITIVGVTNEMIEKICDLLAESYYSVHADKSNVIKKLKRTDESNKSHYYMTEVDNDKEPIRKYEFNGSVKDAMEILQKTYATYKKQSNNDLSIEEFLDDRFFIDAPNNDAARIFNSIHHTLNTKNFENKNIKVMDIQQAKLMPANSKFEIYFNDNKDDNTVILVQDTCKKNNKIFQWMEDSGQKSPLWVTNEILDAKFVLIQEPVDIMTVMKSNKKCKVNHELINAAFEIIGTVNYYDNYDEFNNLMRNLSKDFNGIDLKRIMMEGEWFLEP